jgi:hypothetical protein
MPIRSATSKPAAGVLVTHDPATAGEPADWVGITAGGTITGVINRRKRAGFTHRTSINQNLGK